MEGNVHDFDWDDANTEKCQKHGISIAEIERLFMRDPDVYPDLKHSETESRYFAVGEDAAGRNIVVVFTYRLREGETIIRPISARYMHKREVNRFESYEKEA